MIQFDPGFCFAAACFLLLFPLNWLLSVAAAALVHELAHIVFVFLFGGRIHRLHIRASGCVIECGGLTELEKAISIAAGPVCSLLLLCFRDTVPLMAVCGLIQGLYNLLPVLPLDGGRILQILLFHICPEQETLILRWIKYALWFAGGGILLGIFFLESGRL